MNNSAAFIRVFIALDIPEALHEKIERVQSRLRYLAGASSMRWTRPVQFHLTLEFLGSVEVCRVPELLVAVQSACAGDDSMTLSLEGAGCFPSFEKPSVAWLGASGETRRLADLQRRIREAARDFGERREEREFSAHLTIGRVKNGAYQTARVFGKALEMEAPKIGVLGEWRAASVQMMQSDLSSGGAVYTELGRAELNP